ncbi:hypothetical protein [Pelagibius sp. Alg239-R121]|uniref:hypothetical protein n=1 Tax=Pelagibius sp. Alg239-R121 TaxID=2993448 RepID=UPI0024A72970|nr:hypothetical protein [Pelagibius sp. Alg239-R121]
MRRGLLILSLTACVLLMGLPSAQAQDEKDPSELARESVELMMRSLNLLIERIPQYELPEINENGDIIIRRKRSTAKPKNEDDSDLEKTRI